MAFIWNVLWLCSIHLALGISPQVHFKWHHASIANGASPVLTTWHVQLHQVYVFRHRRVGMSTHVHVLVPRSSTTSNKFLRQACLLLASKDDLDRWLSPPSALHRYFSFSIAIFPLQLRSCRRDIDGAARGAIRRGPRVRASSLVHLCWSWCWTRLASARGRTPWRSNRTCDNSWCFRT